MAALSVVGPAVLTSLDDLLSQRVSSSSFKTPKELVGSVKICPNSPGQLAVPCSMGPGPDLAPALRTLSGAAGSSCVFPALRENASNA